MNVNGVLENRNTVPNGSINHWKFAAAEKTPDFPKNLRVLIYSQDGYGLGHLRRNLSITTQIKQLCPSASVLIIVDSPVAPFFELPPLCDFIKIPTMVKIDYGVWASNRLNMTSSELLPVRADMITNIALSFQPHVFLVDHMPHGALGELTEPIKQIKQLSPHTRMVLGLRDILGGPEDIFKQWNLEGAYDVAEKYYDKVLIYGSPEIFPSAEEYFFSEKLLNKTTYCGFVCRDDTPKEFSNSQLKKLMPKNDLPLLLVTGGGGHDANSFMDIFLDTVNLLKSKLEFQAIVSSGPFMQIEQIQALRDKAKGFPVTVESLGNDAIHFLKRADLLISMAGYNTTSEILRFRKNAIIIPRPGPSAKQTIRTRLLTQRNMFAAIHPNDLTPERLAETIAERLKGGSTLDDSNVPDMFGARNAAFTILNSVSVASESEV